MHGLLHRDSCQAWITVEEGQPRIAQASHLMLQCHDTASSCFGIVGDMKTLLKIEDAQVIVVH